MNETILVVDDDREIVGAIAAALGGPLSPVPSMGNQGPAGRHCPAGIPRPPPLNIFKRSDKKTFVHPLLILGLSNIIVSPEKIPGKKIHYRRKSTWQS